MARSASASNNALVEGHPEHTPAARPADDGLRGMIELLQAALEETEREFLALALELQQLVDERTADLHRVEVELRVAKSALRELSADLERRVALRTAELVLSNMALRAEIDENCKGESGQRTQRPTAAEPAFGVWLQNRSDHRHPETPAFREFQGAKGPGSKSAKGPTRSSCQSRARPVPADAAIHPVHPPERAAPEVGYPTALPVKGA